MRRIDEVEKWVALATRFVAVILVVAILFLIGLQIVSRLFHAPVIWTEELARFCLIWTSLLGCGWLAFTNRHMGLGLDKRPDAPTWSKVLNVAVRIFTLVVVGYLAIISIDSLSAFRGSSAALDIPVWAVYISLPIGMTLWALHELLALVRIAMRRPPENPTYDAGDVILETE